jgi:hypothetical protein
MSSSTWMPKRHFFRLPRSGRSCGPTVADSARDLVSAVDDVLDRIDSLPLSQVDSCFAINWVTSARSLAEAGEPEAARYQVRIVVKKLFPRDLKRIALPRSSIRGQATRVRSSRM